MNLRAAGQGGCSAHAVGTLRRLPPRPDVVIATRGRRGRGAKPAARNALRDTPLDPEHGGA